jgi:hypothetical protein
LRETAFDAVLFELFAGHGTHLVAEPKRSVVLATLPTGDRTGQSPGMQRTALVAYQCWLLAEMPGQAEAVSASLLRFTTVKRGFFGDVKAVPTLPPHEQMFHGSVFARSGGGEAEMDELANRILTRQVGRASRMVGAR